MPAVRYATIRMRLVVETPFRPPQPVPMSHMVPARLTALVPRELALLHWVKAVVAALIGLQVVGRVSRA